MKVDYDAMSNAIDIIYKGHYIIDGKREACLDTNLAEISELSDEASQMSSVIGKLESLETRCLNLNSNIYAHMQEIANVENKNEENRFKGLDEITGKNDSDKGWEAPKFDNSNIEAMIKLQETLAGLNLGDSEKETSSDDGSDSTDPGNPVSTPSAPGVTPPSGKPNTQQPNQVNGSSAPDVKPPESKQEPPDLTKVQTTDQFFGLVKDGNGEYGIRAIAFSRAELSQKTNRYKMIENLLAEKYKLSAEEVELLMKYFEKKGIPNTYVAFMNGVTAIYKNKQDLFEQQFGQPLCGIQEGNKLIMNDTGMVVDAFVGLNSGNSENDLFINKDGKMILNKQLLENENFVPKSHINKDGSLNKELINKYLNSKTEGLSIKESTIDILKADNNTIKNNIQTQLDANKAVEIFDGRNSFVVTATTEEGIHVIDENATKSFISFNEIKGQGTSGGNANVSTTKKDYKLNVYNFE